ncbi:recombination protein NinB [Chromobacterium violaceum]|uniref:recombination protein NinB n=1 Tax=Chromobacterium violaceum TaxID=536 RepID=UPI001C8B40FC|nr:recombination protein NinB [Chromobacterium violaceum]MBX9267226.1 recombination protein NinB [Chromobacterium violaceum]
MSRETLTIQTGADLRPRMARAYQLACQMLNEAAGGKGLKVTIQTASIRNLSQNAAMWAALTDISEQLDWYGNELTPEEWKDLLTASLRRTKVVPNIDGSGFVILGQRTSDMSIREMGELLELIHAFGAEKGVKFGLGSAYGRKAA